MTTLVNLLAWTCEAILLTVTIQAVRLVARNCLACTNFVWIWLQTIYIAFHSRKWHSGKTLNIQTFIKCHHSFIAHSYAKEILTILREMKSWGWKIKLFLLIKWYALIFIASYVFFPRRSSTLGKQVITPLRVTVDMNIRYARFVGCIRCEISECNRVGGCAKLKNRHLGICKVVCTKCSRRKV